VLVVAATRLELERIEAAESLVCGIGPVEATLATARALEVARPDAVLNVGIAGARALEPGSIVIGSESIYCDLADPSSTIRRVDRLKPDEALLDLAGRALPAAHRRPIATSARVGGGQAYCDVEAMEGFGVLRAAAESGVPALELRAISNRFDDERSAWRVESALASLAEAVATLLGVLGA